MKKGSSAIWKLGCVILLLAVMGVCLPVGAASRKQTLCTVIRESPSAEGRIIGTMAEGAAVLVLEQAGEYYKIDCYDMEGYVAVCQTKKKKDGCFISCDPGSEETEGMGYVSATEAERLRQGMMGLARSRLGAPYSYGSSGPWGFDCSGLTSYLYDSYGMQISRRASLQMADGLIVAKEHMQAGDLLFFREPGETELVSHVGIYVGENRMIHAGSEGVSCVELTGEYFGDYFLCARRIVCTERILSPEVLWSLPERRMLLPRRC